MLDKPGRDVRLVLLEVPGRGEVEPAGASGGAVLEVMRDAAGDEDEGALRGVMSDPYGLLGGNSVIAAFSCGVPNAPASLTSFFALS